jgi:cell division protein FtsZ
VLLLIVSGTNEITIDEIGEINDHIQVEAGHNANIIMGVGEDESLGESVAVTIIATGFNVEQQKEIINTEPLKIIHTLEDEQKSTLNLTQKVISSFDFLTAIPSNNSTERIVHELMEEPAAPIAVVVKTEPTFEYNLVPTTEFIKNLEVTFEIVSPKIEQDFFFTTPEVKEIIVKQPQFVEKPQEQISLPFDLPILKAATETQKEDRILFELTNETRNIQVNDVVQVVPVTELNENGIIRYSLEEYMEIENNLLNSKPVVAPIEEPINETLQFTSKIIEETPNSFSSDEQISPTEMSLEQASQLRSEERRRKLKEFNYKFHNNPSRVEEYEKEPAYKRLGVDISSKTVGNNQSRTSLGMDSNNDIQLRSNNSYLHDNVD